MSRWDREAAAVVKALRSAALPERRAKSASYCPSALEILGVPVPAIRGEVRRLAKAHRGAAAADVLALAWALRATGIHEVRQVAFEVVGGRRDVISGLDGATAEALGAGNDNWASVDGFCVFVAGPAWRDGAVADGDVARWAGSPDRWWRRTALVSTVPLNMRSRGGTGDAARTLEVCRLLAGDGDPMVAKGLSWALRALVPVDPGSVRAFLRERDDGLPARVRREVVSKLETGRKNPRP